MENQHVIFVDLHFTLGGLSITDRFSLRQALIRRNVPVVPGKGLQIWLGPVERMVKTLFCKGFSQHRPPFYFSRTVLL